MNTTTTSRSRTSSDCCFKSNSGEKTDDLMTLQTELGSSNSVNGGGEDNNDEPESIALSHSFISFFTSSNDGDDDDQFGSDRDDSHSDDDDDASIVSVSYHGDLEDNVVRCTNYNLPVVSPTSSSEMQNEGLALFEGDEESDDVSNRSTRTTSDTTNSGDSQAFQPSPHQQRQRSPRHHHEAPSRIKKRKRQLFPMLTPIKAKPFDSHSTTTTTASASCEPVVVLGIDISHMSRVGQFLVCAAGVFGFNLSFGYLQEFVSVEICNRNLGLFLAMMQFTGYTGLSYVLRNYVNHNQKKSSAHYHAEATATGAGTSATISNNNSSDKLLLPPLHPPVPHHMYIGLGVLSAIDMAMTNMAMLYINYPAKTLLKSSRVVFTMIFGVLMAGKRYRLVDYLVVLCMVTGLAIFMQADARSSAIFEPLGVVMLTISLLCDGATNVMSETIMKTYGVGQDELIFRMYSLALIAVTAAATFGGDLRIGLIWMTRPGTYDEWQDGASQDEITWNVLGKITIIVLFSIMGFFGSSCSAAITKNFGALTMSITSTARRATTLFISFFLFDNECTFLHIAGVIIFIMALITKSFLSSSKTKSPKTKLPLSPPPDPSAADDVDLRMREQEKCSPGGVAKASSASVNLCKYYSGPANMITPWMVGQR